MTLDLGALLEPIVGDTPVGMDLRTESGLNSIYFKLKDARAQARTIERAMEAAGEPPSIPHEWHAVRALSLEALQTRSKDLEIAAWLVESLLRLDGFAGLAAGFALNQALIEAYWPDIHSIDEDDAAGRISPLAGLNGIGSEGALVQPIRMVPLIPESTFGTNALWHLNRIQKEPDSAVAREFHDARATAGMAAIRERAIEASAARESFAKLNATLDTICGADAPPSSNIRNVLDDVLEAYRSLIGTTVDVDAAAAAAKPGDVDFVEEALADEAQGDAAVAQSAPVPIPTAPREISSREEAFTELLRVADFFRRNEPHSPISFTLDTLVWRGRMNFIDLLEELLPDAEHRKQLLQHAGIHANVDGKTR